MQPSPTSFPPLIFVTHEYDPFRGGTATFVRETAQAVRRIGKAVAVWTVDYDMESLVNESSVDMPVVRLASSGRLTPAGLLRFAWGIWRQRTKLHDEPLVLASVGAQMAFFLLFALGARVGGRVVCLFHGSEILRFTRNPFLRWLATCFYRRHADAFAVTTPYVEGLLRHSALLPLDAEIIIAPCALPTMFHVEHPVPAGKTSTVESKPYRIVTVARLHPRKGQLEAARALALLPEKWRPEIVYQVVGTGSDVYRRQVESVCLRNGIRCEFTGLVDDATLAIIYAHATLYLQASRTLAQSVEGFGLTFLEASAHGCPVAAWRSGGVASAVLNGETGLLANEGDLTGLARAVERLLSDPELRNQLGEQGRRHARSFSWDQTARTLCAAAEGKSLKPSMPAPVSS